MQQLADSVQDIGWGIKSWQAVHVHRDHGCLRFAPPAVADALISLHVAGLCTARWKACIDAEWINAAARDHDKSSEKLEHLVMRCALLRRTGKFTQPRMKRSRSARLGR